MGKIHIHATNIKGIGAIQVVNSLLSPLVDKLKEYKVRCYLSEDIDKSVLSGKNLTRHLYKRLLPNTLSRLIEVVCAPIFFPKALYTIVLGDIPLFGKKNQIVLVHQNNLIKPAVERYSATNLKFKVLRTIFALNARYVKFFVVQTDAMKKGLVLSYGIDERKIKVIPQPTPAWFRKPKRLNCIKPQKKVSLFYPAAFYPHKNHDIIQKMDLWASKFDFDFELVVTVDPENLPFDLKDIKWVTCVGLLSHNECLEYYTRCSALFFPSVMESYGLPLVEAMAAAIPVICSDLPYARWMCGGEAIYFDPLDGESACHAVKELRAKLSAGEITDWGKELQKIPETWDDVAERFVKLM